MSRRVCPAASVLAVLAALLWRESGLVVPSLAVLRQDQVRPRLRSVGAVEVEEEVVDELLLPLLGPKRRCVDSWIRCVPGPRQSHHGQPSARCSHPASLSRAGQLARLFCVLALC